MHVTRCPVVLQNATTEVSRDWCSLIRVQRNLGGLANVIVTLDVVNRAVASGGGGRAGRAATPPGPVEPDKSILLMDLFPLDSVILIIVTCMKTPALSHLCVVDFSETYLMTSAENSVS